MCTFLTGPKVYHPLCITLNRASFTPPGRSSIILKDPDKAEWHALEPVRRACDISGNGCEFGIREVIGPLNQVTYVILRVALRES